MVVVIVFLLLAAGLGVVAYLVYQRKLRRAKAIERGLKMVPVQIHLPPSSADTVAGGRDVREVMREQTAQAEVLYNLLAGTASEGFKSTFYGQRHIALEIVASQGLVHFYAAVPVALVSVVEKAIQTAYPGSRLEEVEDHNIFNQEGRLAATMGGELLLKAASAYPIATYQELERDPLEAIITTLSSMGKDDGAAIQVMVRPAGSGWVKQSTGLADKLRKGESKGMGFSAIDLAKAVVAPPTTAAADAAKQTSGPSLSNLQLGTIERIENKTKQPGFEVLIRLVVSTQTVATSQQLLRDLATAFALYEAPGLNGFKFLPAIDVQGLVTAFILRFFPPEMHSNILNSAELASIFHLPDSQFVPTTNVERQASKEVDGPVSLPATGLLMGFNEFRGVKKEIRLSEDDRRRHTYILGQTGTGKSTLLENLVVQDMLAGNGFAFIDPHGDTAEKLLSMVPKSRAEDVIYFNPADTEYPLGFNLFEFSDPAQKDFIIQESINMLTKIYDPGKTGVIGPRFEQWFRNAALTLMSDPSGATFIEIPKVFTDTEYLKQKFRYLKDPTVIEFWTKEMGQTSDYHKSEMLGYFVSKFGAFLQNEIMRNIMGQTKSAFNLRDVMDNKKILIVNLSKGKLGELNSQLLGMMFVIKFQAAAMSRADMPESERTDFALYVDEFQNFSTDSFASILSEARKYRLNLIVANQYVGQLSNEIRDAVFGNIGTIVAHRMGPEDAEFMTKQFAPVFDARDLVNIPNYHSAMRLMIGGLPSQPFTMRNLPPLGNPNAELGQAIKQLSAAKFGSAKSVVEASITARLSSTPVAPVPATATPTPPTETPIIEPSAATPAIALPAVPMVEPIQPTPVEAPVPEAPVTLPEPAIQTPPVITQPVPAPQLMNLAVTPPPIGAPPVDSISAPVAEVRNTAGQVMEPVPPIIAEPEVLPVASAPAMSAPALADKPGGLSISDITGGRPLPQPTTQPAPLAMPPIGAPPIDLPYLTPPPSPVANFVPAQAAMPAQPVFEPLNEAAAALNDIPLIPAGSEPKPRVDAPASPNAPAVTSVVAPEYVELVDTPVADDPMASVPLFGDFTPIQVPGTPLAPVTVPAVSESSPVFDPSSMVALTLAEHQQQPHPLTEPVAVPMPEPAQITPAPPVWVEVPATTPTAEPAPTFTPEPEPREPSAPALPAASEPVAPVSDDIDFSGSLVHFIDPELETVMDKPSYSAVPAPELAAPVNVPSSAQLAVTPPPIGAPPVDSPGPVMAGTVTPPVAVSEPAIEEAELPWASVPVPEPAPITEPSEPVSLHAEAIEAVPQPVDPVPSEAPAEVVTDPVPVPEVVEETQPVVESAPEPQPAEAVPAATLPLAAPEVPEIITAPEAAVRSDEAPEAEEAKRSSDEVLSEVMEAARRRQAERDAAPGEASASLPVEPSSEPVIAKPMAAEAVAEPVITPASDEEPAKDPVIEAEDQIDDLLNVSFVHDSNHSTPRLPDPADEAGPEPEIQAEADDVVASTPSAHHRLADPAKLVSSESDAAPDPEDIGRDHALTGGHKVIQPLEPIVSHHDEIVEALAKLEAEEKAEAAATQIAAAPVAAPVPKPSPVPTPAIASMDAVLPTVEEPVAHPEPVLPPPALVPFEAVAAETPIVEPPVPIAIAEEDFGLPPAESLEAGDVAAARSKREAEEREAAAAEAEQARSTAATKPAPEPSPELEVEQPPADEPKPATPKRKRQRNRPKAEAAADATATDASAADGPDEADPEHAPAGQLIMPNAAAAASQPTPAPRTSTRPANLAKGDIFVDDKGNVIVGE